MLQKRKETKAAHIFRSEKYKLPKKEQKRKNEKFLFKMKKIRV